MHKHIPSIVIQKFFIQHARGKAGVAEVRTLRKYNIISVKNMHRAYHMHNRILGNMQSNSHNNILTDFELVNEAESVISLRCVLWSFGLVRKCVLSTILMLATMTCKHSLFTDNMHFTLQASILLELPHPYLQIS